MTVYTKTSDGIPVLHDRCAITGIKSTLVRPGFSDYATWGDGLACATEGYCLDAPSSLPRGSTSGAVYSHCTGGVGRQHRAFVTQQTTPVNVFDDRT